jgi:hypothetical protein
MITTDKPERLDMTLKAMHSIDRNSQSYFKEKVLSIDELGLDNEYTLGLLRQAVTSMGWIAVSGPCSGQRGMVNNMLRGLPLITSDLLFYCEDHVIYEKIPSEDVINSIFNRKAQVRWINLNTHIVEDNLIDKMVNPNVEEILRKEQECLKYIRTDSNYLSYGSDCFLLKSEELADDYFLNFPAIITTTKIFSILLTAGCQNYHDVGIEIGFTKAWFDCRFPAKFKVAIYVKPEARVTKPLTFDELHYYAWMRFRNNDLSKLHDSIAQHDHTPDNPKQRNAFF